MDQNWCKRRNMFGMCTAAEPKWTSFPKENINPVHLLTIYEATPNRFTGFLANALTIKIKFKEFISMFEKVQK